MEYTYTIKCKISNKMYHGCRVSKDAHPSEFWDTYFTSSSIVHALIKENGVTSFEIIEVTPYINCGAYEAETQFLIENNCAASDNWLNMSNNEFSKCHMSDLVKSRMMAKYGVEHNSQLASTRLKISKKQKEIWKSLEYREHRKDLSLSRHNVEHHMKSKEISQKVKDTCIEKYGVTNVFATEEVKTKIKETFEEKYNGHPRKTHAVKDKYTETIKHKYNVDHFSKTDIFKDKIQDTWKQKSVEDLEEHTNNSKNVRANDPILECQHCGKFIKNKGLFNRWHNDNCKQNKG